LAFVFFILWYSGKVIRRKKAEGYVLRGFWVFKRFVKDEPKE
jgi:hypothetical protein